MGSPPGQAEARHEKIAIRLTEGLVAIVDAAWLTQSGLSHSDCSSFLMRLVDDPEAIGGYQSLKYSKESEIFRITPAVGPCSLDLVCRRMKVKSAGQFFRKRLMGGFYDQSSQRAEWMEAAGLCSSRPIVGIRPSSRHRYEYVLSEFVPDLVDLGQVALQLLPQCCDRRRRSVKRDIARSVVELMVRFEQHKLAHRDLKASNIMLQRWNAEDASICLYILDLEGLQRKRVMTQARRHQPLVRLAASLLAYSSVTRTDYATFCKHYLSQKQGDGRDWKNLFRDLSERATAYARSSTSRKTHKLDGYLGDA